MKHVTSCPHFESSNCSAERAVVKRLWRQSADKQFALLNYRTTPLEDVNMSPPQLLMERRPRNTLPAASDILRPNGQNLDQIKQSLQSIKDKQKASFNSNSETRNCCPYTLPIMIVSCPHKERGNGSQEL